jgi:hypothetical protein
MSWRRCVARWNHLGFANPPAHFSLVGTTKPVILGVMVNKIGTNPRDHLPQGVA